MVYMAPATRNYALQNTVDIVTVALEWDLPMLGERGVDIKKHIKKEILKNRILKINKNAESRKRKIII